jgi:hypothetical protein
MIAPASVRAQPAFDDPDAVLDVVRGGGPYWPLARYALNESERAAVGGDSGGGGFVPPWFRQDFALDGIPLVDDAGTILHNAAFISAAGRVFGEAVIVRPTTVYVNIMGPTSFPFVAHVDVPAFRGITRAEYPVWLLHQMQVSGLFDPWRIRLATAVSWFYAGPGGSFHYWPEGAAAPAVVESPPFENVAIVADNEHTYHGVSALGLPDAELPSHLTVAAELHRRNNGWVVVEGGEEVISYTDHTARVTVSWKAEIYDDQADADRIAEHTDDLDLATVVDVFLTDLHDRGVEAAAPGDPLEDEAWIGVLTAAYRESAPRIG